MGMSATQARYLSLVAQQSNLEYQGQQINQERSILSQQVSELYNSLLNLQVPTPPSTTDYTTVQYTGADGATLFTLGNVKPSGENYLVEIQTSATGHALQSNYGSSVVERAGETITGTFVNPTIDSSVTITNAELATYYYVDDNGNAQQLHPNSPYLEPQDDGSFKLIDGMKYLKAGAGPDTAKDPNAGAYTIAGEVALEFEDAKEMYPDEFDWSSYEEAIRNTYGMEDSSIKPSDFNVFIKTSDTGVRTVQFALKSDVTSPDGFAQTFSYTSSGKFTKSEEIDQCKLQFDAAGRITAISIPTIDKESGKVIAYRDIALTATSVTDELAYEEAMAKYEYAQYEYDKKQQEINAKTEVIQQQDRNLELKLQRLDTQRQQITTEIEALEKVLQDNIEASYKTFSG